MDPFTQRMLERARARQEKIDQKLASTGQTPKRRPLIENALLKSETPAKSPVKPAREAVLSPKNSIKEPKSKSPIRSPIRKSVQKVDASPQRQNDFIVTKKEYKTPKRISNSKRNSDVSVEINIMHRDDIQIEVQVEERDAPMTVLYDSAANTGSNVVINEIQDDSSKKMISNSTSEHRAERSGLRRNVKSQLDRLGVLYSDNRDLSSPIHRMELQLSSDTLPASPAGRGGGGGDGKHNRDLSSPIHRTELQFSSDTPPAPDTPRPAPPAGRGWGGGDGKRKFGRLAALADRVNNWEDDLSHHGPTEPPATKKPTKTWTPERVADQSTLDVSIHSLYDINTALKTAAQETSKPVNSRTFTKPTNIESQALHKNIVAELEGQGYRRVSAGQSRLVYDFTTNAPEQIPSEATPSAAAAPDMAAMIAAHPPLAKKPSIKKYRAPTPPQQVDVNDKDKENNLLQREENDNYDAPDTCVQTNEAEGKAPEKGSPVVKRIAPKLNGNVDRNSVLSRAAMFEAGSPREKQKDPAEMSLRERKALFEKNKGAAIIPKAPFGLAPSAKALHGETKADPKPARPVVTHSRSKENIPEETSHGGGIKGKLAALFNKEQTISESTIANKFKQEREREMEMLQNRFHYKPKPDSDDEHDDADPSEAAPLMGSSLSLNQAAKKPEIYKKPESNARNPESNARKPESNARKPESNAKPEVIATAPKVQFEKAQSVTELRDERRDVVNAQPGKRRSSQDSQVVLSVLEEVKRIKVNDKKSQPNGVQPSLYPHLSDIETDTSHTQEEYSDCGGSSEDISSDPRNKSDNWAETSFGRDVMNVVKKNNSSYKKAVRETDSETSNSDMNSELDDMLDEALNDDDSEGPTPPKLNKHANSLSSKSFTYEDGSPGKKHFKSPLKMAPATPRPDKGNELVHSVSFYRRAQNAGSQPSTPHRIVRHASPERDIEPATPEQAAATVTTVRQRIKELQAEINKQQTVISQASQALNLCAATVEFSGSTEQAEGERLLLLATHRRQACLHEVQRLQVEGAGAGAAAGMASLHISGLSVPLRRDYVRKLNADGAVGHHAVCLLKCRDRVLATSMQSTSPAAAALTFPDDIRMDGIASDFKVTIEVYLLQASEEKLPHDVKYHIFSKKSTSKLLTPKSKVSELKAPRVQSPAGPLSVRSPQFSAHGYCIFALQQATRSVFTLNKVPSGSPLDGAVNISIRCALRVPPPPPHAAFLTAFDDVSGLGAWHRRWFRLQAPNLAYWRYPDDVTKKLPIGYIDLTSVTSDKVVKAPRDLCARPNTLLMESVVPAGLIVPDSGSLVYFKKADGTLVRRHLLAADTQRDRDLWLDTLNQALEYVRCCQANGEE